MTAPLDPAWIGFFATAASASATLVGLIIVAMSVNLQRILAFYQLPSRAAGGIGLLTLSLCASIAVLMPQPTTALAVEILGFAALVWLVQIRAAQKMMTAPLSERRPAAEMLASISAAQIQVLPFVVGGIELLAGDAGGAYWVAGGVVATFAGSVFNAWVLLVEILR
jgi:hypothetical protein